MCAAENRRTDPDTDTLSAAEAENLLLRRAIEAITSSLELDEVLGATLDLVTEATGGDACFLLLWDDERECLVLRAASAQFQSAVGKVQLHLDEGVSGWVAAHREVVVIPEDKWADARYKYFPELGGEQFTSMLSVPMITASGELVGVFNVHFRERPRFAETDVGVLRLIASLIASAIENANLFQAIADKEAALQDLVGKTIEVQEEERRRVATEIHDGVTQQLVSIWYRLNACGQNLRDDPDRAEGELAAASELVDGALSEARSAIYDLRPSILDDLGLAPSLRTLAQRQLKDENVDAELEVDGGLILEPHQEVALYRIAQEAVTNVRKHANAHLVRIVLRGEPAQILLRVSDDGDGFDMWASRARGPATSFGLTGMTERATLVGGQLTVHSAPGDGTTIELRIPRQASEENA